MYQKKRGIRSTCRPTSMYFSNVMAAMSHFSEQKVKQSVRNSVTIIMLLRGHAGGEVVKMVYSIMVIVVVFDAGTW